MKMSIPLRLDAWSNLRGHWRTLEKRKRKEKDVTSTALMFHDKPPLPIVVTFTRISIRNLDDDNLPTAFKYVRDTIALAYGTHDGPSAPIRWAYRQRKPLISEPRHGFEVEIEHEPEAQP